MFHHSQTPKDMEIARYTFSVLHLERKLSTQAHLLTEVRQRIQRAEIQATHFSTLHDNVLANLASIYTDTFASFPFRIQVLGEPVYLNQTHYINKIRALLLAGIRSAVLWRQRGGHRWQFLLFRHSLVTTAQRLLMQYTAPQKITEPSPP
jgi:high frequency lysogenization protein